MSLTGDEVSEENGLLKLDMDDHIDEESCRNVGTSATTSKTTQKKGHKEHKEETRRNGWSLLEKAMTLRGLKLYGLTNKKDISKMVVTKDEDEVQKFLRNSLKQVQAQDNKLKKREYYYSKKREYKLTLLQEKKQTEKRLEKKERMALHINDLKCCMLKSRKEELLPDNISAALSRTLLLISKFENHPHPNVCNGADFSAAYLFLSKLLTCQYLTSKTVLPNIQTKRYIWKCFQKLIDMVPKECIMNK